MSTKSIEVALEESLLKRLDGDPEVRSMGRSAFVRKAIDHYFRARGRREIDANLIATYQGKAADMAEEVDALIEAQAWPED